ncbi:MAG: CoA pyrophosphatase [Dehalococcoidales bacterium]|nr:CoA pyrophosphatase [Dehalococcoidales bacterium]
MKTMKEKIRQYLIQHPGRQILNNKYTPSAVVLPVFRKDTDWHILFIKRTETVEHHKGQISFPGGRHEPEDKTLRDTALREIHEEIGLPPENVEILGQLDDSLTFTSNFIVSTFIGLIPYPYKFKPDPGEIAYIFTTPVSNLLSNASFQKEERYIDNHLVRSYFFYYQNEVIWGATARILKQFLEIWAVLSEKQPG